jgi:AcrR family transcriptional regulator
MVKQNLEDSSGAQPRSRRAVQADQTRAEILSAARRLFASQGYAGTSLKDIAADAGVSVQTVYDSVGSKADLVRRLNDLIDAEAQVGEIAMRLGTETDPYEVARVPGMITRRIVERCSDILRGSLDAARAEHDLGHVLEEGGRRHRVGARAVAERLAALDALAEDMSVESAAVTIGALADFRVALLLIDDHGLDLDAVEKWMTTTTAQALLRRDEMEP